MLVLHPLPLSYCVADGQLLIATAAEKKRLKVVADTANGMGGLVVPAVLGRVPLDLEMLYAELDGTFPNHPADPIQPENLRDLQALVKSSHADIGLAFDGDADRVFLVDEAGQPVSDTIVLRKTRRSRFPGDGIAA